VIYKRIPRRLVQIVFFISKKTPKGSIYTVPNMTEIFKVHKQYIWDFNLGGVKATRGWTWKVGIPLPSGERSGEELYPLSGI